MPVPHRQPATSAHRVGGVVLLCSVLLGVSACTGEYAVQPAPVIPSINPGTGLPPSPNASASGRGATRASTAEANPARKAGKPRTPKAAPRQMSIAIAAPAAAEPLPTATAAPRLKPAAPTRETAVPALPKPGLYRYQVQGRSNLGRLPDRMSLDVSAAEGGQRWIFDATAPGRIGSIEDVTVRQEADGLYLTRADLIFTSGGITRLDLRFRPERPVLLVPVGAIPGRTWSFDLITVDGCATGHTAGSILDPVDGLDRLRLDSTLVGTGRPGCSAINARRTQDFWRSPTSFVPTRLDTTAEGTVSGLPVKLTSRAERAPGSIPCRPTTNRRDSEDPCG